MPCLTVVFPGAGSVPDGPARRGHRGGGAAHL